MMAETLSITAHDGGQFDGFLYAPPKLPAPGIVMVPEIFGINEPLRAIAATFAAQGFLVLMIDLFWRHERHVAIDYNPEGFKRARDFHAAFSYADGTADADAAVEMLRRHPGCTGKVGLVGYCLGGTLAYRAAITGKVEAAVGYYPTKVSQYFTETASVKKPLMMHLAEHDALTPDEVMAKVLPELAAHPQVTPHVYPDAGHAFANPRGPGYHAESAKSADARAYAFLHRWLD
jgi:carboxymethylenebutenolidase